MMETEKRLIDLDAYEDFKSECLTITTPGLHSFDAGFEEGMERAAEWLDLQPTVDAVEVVHGQWDAVFEYKDFQYAHCSVCGKRSEYMTKFCPNCGSKMDGERRTDG